jgi:hypothetical protein
VQIRYEMGVGGHGGVRGKLFSWCPIYPQLINIAAISLHLQVSSPCHPVSALEALLAHKQPTYSPTSRRVQWWTRAAQDEGSWMEDTAGHER